MNTVILFLPPQCPLCLYMNIFVCVYRQFFFFFFIILQASSGMRDASLCVSFMLGGNRATEKTSTATARK